MMVQMTILGDEDPRLGCSGVAGRWLKRYPLFVGGSADSWPPRDVGERWPWLGW